MSVEIMALFEKLNRDNRTIIMVTHEPDIAQYAHRKVTFRDGHVLSDEQSTSPRSAIDELAARPTAKGQGEA
jgi:ABC-type antimicrobial peptide transport system, ATPase component